MKRTSVVGVAVAVVAFGGALILVNASVAEDTEPSATSSTGASEGADNAAGEGQRRALKARLSAAEANSKLLAQKSKALSQELDSLRAKSQEAPVPQAAVDSEEDQPANEEEGPDDSKPVFADFDLSQEDWADLAERGQVNSWVPCDEYVIDDAEVEKLGLNEVEADGVRAAYAKSQERMRANVLPVCKASLGATGGKVTPRWCLRQITSNPELEDVDVYRRVAESRAGFVDAGLDRSELETMWLAVSRESELLRDDLAEYLPVERAHQLVFGGELCGVGNKSRGNAD